MHDGAVPWLLPFVFLIDGPLTSEAMTMGNLTRREFHGTVAGAVAAACGARFVNGEEEAPFTLTYIVASSMYGKLPLAELLPEVKACGAEYVEIWAEPHGNQREQIDAMGAEAFAALMADQEIRLGSFTCFKYGIFNMQSEMALVKQLGGDMVICNSGGPKDLAGAELKSEVEQFAEKLKPHVEAAEETDITIGLENHSGGLISSPDSIRMLLDLLPSEHLGLAMAPYHLPQDPETIGGLIRELDSRLVHIQAWEYGMGCMTQLPKEQELLQLPHRGPMDWTPILAALMGIRYAGRVEVFMHPTPRGIPILETPALVTAEINKAREYLEACLTN